MADGEKLKPLVGELLPPFPRVMVQANPFTPAATREHFGVGTTIAEMVASAGIPVEYADCVQVFIGDEEMNCALWSRIKPKPGAEVFIRVSLRGGDGGKDVLRAVAMIAIVVVVMMYAPMLAGHLLPGAGFLGSAAVVGLTEGLVAGALMTAGMMLVNALIPPPTPKSQWGFDQDLGNPYGQITGMRNQAAPYGPIPRVFGKRRMFPMMAGRPYTETVGNDQYLIILLLVGYGPLRISDVKLGETPITNTPGIEMEVREGWPDDAPVTLYRKAIREDSYGVVLDGIGSETIKTTKLDTIEISVELNFPSGVNRVKDGELRYHEVEFSVQYRPTGSGGGWLDANWIDRNSAYGTQNNGRIFVRDKTQNGLRKAGRWAVPKGQYDVKVTRLSAKEPMGETGYCMFTALRSIVDQPFLPMPGLSLMALRMKASGQLNGVPDQVNCVAESYLPVHNGTSWSYQITRNPAWAYADLLRRRGLQTIHDDSRIDLPTIRNWAAACDGAAPNGPGAYWTFDGVMEGGSIFTGLRTAASHGRASFTIKDGKYSVVRDMEQTVPVQHISPRNSWGYSGSKVFTDVPHAIRVRFPNEERQYGEDEVVVYAPGYSEQGAGGTTAASKFETLDMPGCSRASQAWREGMYYLAVLLLRPETHIVSMDVENLRCTLGSFVRFSHDVIKIGLGWGRVKERIVTGGNVTALVLDGVVEMAAGKSYGLRCRRDDFATVVMNLSAFVGETDVVSLAAPLPLANAPDVGDLYQFGEAGMESAPMMVKRIAPGGDLTATVTLVDAQPGVWTADRGVIPPFNTYITNPTPTDRVQPPVPIMRLTSDSNTARYVGDGTVIERIAVSFDSWPSGEALVDTVEVQYRDLESPDFTPMPRLPRDASGTFIDNVQAGAEYEVRSRTLTAANIPSDWAVGQIEAAGKTFPPEAPKSLTATAGERARMGFVGLRWTLSKDIDLWGTEVWASETNDRAAAVLIDVVADPGTTYMHALEGVTQRYYWVRSVDTSGNLSSSPLNPPQFRWFPEGATDGVLGETVAVELPPGTVDDLFAELDLLFNDRFTQLNLDLTAAIEAAEGRLNLADALLATAITELDLTDINGFTTYSANVQSVLDGKASNIALGLLQSQQDGLSGRVVTIETAITNLPDEYASAARASALEAEVHGARGTALNLNARLLADQSVVADALAGKVSVTDFNGLSARIGTAEGSISAQNNRLDSVEADVAGKASSSTVSSLTARVGTAEANITYATSVAAAADGKASSIWGFVQDVNGYSTGISSVNNGTISMVKIRTDKLEIGQPGGGERTEYSNGHWRCYDSSNRLRVAMGVNLPV